ncbi:phage tail spike protein [Niallia taxi]|uniref:phage tail spike protein n=1 Tax=Niallia taxi TaxID=2499688 RepID=UPI00254AAAC6|nr:phage tail spike protein [Niallia taxi]MDK8641336.1 phage tail spike protein [Niallia taxi]
MFEVKIINNGDEIIIHTPTVDGVKLPTGTIKQEINLIDSFNFSLYINNPGYGKIKPLKTLINVWNTKTQKFDFEGRILGPSESMDNTGLVTASYLCEGELGYLHDSQQQHFEFRGTAKQLFSKIINYHNSQVEEYKQFKVGEVAFIDDLYLYLSAEQKTFDTIKEKLIDNLGGELQIRKENGVRFLDWLERVGEDKDTEIVLSKNLISISRDIDPSEIVTRLTPLGARIESTNEGATDASEARLTIESVNYGLPYIDNIELIKEFGIQGGSVTWDDVTLPDNLLSKGRGWFNQQKTSLNQFKLSAVDLALIELDIDYLDKGNSYPVKNSIMGIDERLRVIGKSLDINNPQNAGLTIGDKFKTLGQYQVDGKKSEQRISLLQNTLDNQVKKIGTLSNDLSTTKQDLVETKQILENYQNTTGTNLTEVNEQVKTLLGVVEDLQEAITNIESVVTVEQIQAMHQGISNNSEGIATINEMLVLINQSLEQLNKRVTNLENPPSEGGTI